MTVSAFIDALDKTVPKSLCEDWDNDGISLLPCEGAEVSGVVAALDATSGAIDFALRAGANVLLTHHPLVFHPMTEVDCRDAVGRRVLKCAAGGIAVISLHTRLDSVSGGVNDCLAARLELSNALPFLPFGRIGEYESEMTFKQFSDFASERLGEMPQLAVKCGNVKRVAVVSGGGKDYIYDALNAGADTFLTGEANHSAAIEAHELGINLLCMTHHATERVVLPFLADTAKRICPEATASVFDFERVNEYGI